MKKENTASSSFRDPDGFIFYRKNKIYRQINKSYKTDYHLLIKSGLYKSLTNDGLLIPHKEVDIKKEIPELAYKIIQPEPIDFISYPYEWCFSQLKDAALTTIRIQKTALKHGMSLKDSSAYNIQFHKGKPVFIDTLSFEKYSEGKPWPAYRQFCQHFLAPLALACYLDDRLIMMMRDHIDGIPLDLASKLLPSASKLSLSILTHIHLHAKSQKHYADKAVVSSNRKISLFALTALLDNLENAVLKLSKLKINRKNKKTTWSHYYQETNYTEEGLKDKTIIVSDFLKACPSGTVWDMGANTGRFSRESSEQNNFTLSFDGDPQAVELNYRTTIEKGETNILPLVIDLANPSPGIGWNNEERDSFLNRGPAKTALALALIHHLAIADNLPLPRIASFFASACNSLIIEFVPKEDSQTKRLLAVREDIFTDYNESSFKKEFGRYFKIKKDKKIKDSLRTLYLMQKK